MFGSRKKQEENNYLEKELVSKQVTLDRYFQVVSEIAIRQKVSESGFDSMEASQEKIGRYLEKAMESVNGAKEVNARQTERSYALCRQAEKLSEGVEDSQQRYQAVIDNIKEQSQQMLDLIENQKEAAEPSRVFNQTIAELTLQIEEMKKSLEEMENMGKQMSVIALKSAVEAGKLGEHGKNFLESIQEVRSLSGKYYQEADQMSQNISQVAERLQKAEEQADALNQMVREHGAVLGNAARGYTSAIYDMEHSESQNLPVKMRKLADYMRKMTENNKVLERHYEVAESNMKAAGEEFEGQKDVLESLSENSEVVKEQIKVAKLATMEE